jgi:hypothetical protein
MRMEGLRKLENRMASSGTEPSTFRLDAYCPCVPRLYTIKMDYLVSLALSV